MREASRERNRRSKETMETPCVPQISVWTHIDCEGAGGVWTGPGPADTDTGVWSSDPDSSVQVSSPTLGRELSLDSPPGYQSPQYCRYPYQTVPSQATPSPPDSSICNSFSNPMIRPSQTISITTSLYPQTSTEPHTSLDAPDCFPSDKEDIIEPHICRCRSSEPLTVSWTPRTPTSPAPDSSPASTSPGSSTNVDLLPSTRTVNQQELPSPGSAPWHQAAATGSDSKNYCKKTLP